MPGIPAENHHVCPIHPEYVELPKIARDVEKAKALMDRSRSARVRARADLVGRGLAQEHRRRHRRAAARGRHQGEAHRLPGSTFWNDWTKYPYSMTNWNMRPLGVQVLALAYRTGEAWNETAFSDPAFDKPSWARRWRSPTPRSARNDEGHREDPAGLGHHHPAVLAQALQPQFGQALREEPSACIRPSSMQLGKVWLEADSLPDGEGHCSPRSRRQDDLNGSSRYPDPK
jgi:hypothetical protein